MKKIQKLVAIIASLNCAVLGLCNNIHATESDVKNNSSTFDAKLAKEQFFLVLKKD